MGRGEEEGEIEVERRGEKGAGEEQCKEVREMGREGNIGGGRGGGAERKAAD